MAPIHQRICLDAIAIIAFGQIAADVNLPASGHMNALPRVAGGFIVRDGHIAGQGKFQPAAPGRSVQPAVADPASRDMAEQKIILQPAPGATLEPLSLKSQAITDTWAAPRMATPS